ncbi:MAG: hypothetical protein EU516_01805 [Promethearchaeota archaeon]|nr:MAG: hypothetical protein EU516_01805 [Candidatus Lokiarchaeota archaeon]
MAKDKIIGLIVMILGILIAIVYTMGSILDLFFETLGANPEWDSIFMIFGHDWLDWRLFVVLPLWLIVILISIIAIWIGYSMLTIFSHLAEDKLYACTRSIGRIGRGISRRRGNRGDYLII